MSIKSAFKKDFSKCDRYESSDFSKMVEHLTDSNILQSKRTYGRKINYESVSVCSENRESFPAFVEELYAEANTTFATSITSGSYRKNNDQKDVDLEFCLFKDEDIDYDISGSADLEDRISSPKLDTASSRPNYQRTKKNLKDRLSNEQYSSEKTFKLLSHEVNSNSVTDDKELKSATDFLNLNQANHTKNDAISSDDPADALPQKSSTTSTNQVAKQTEIVFGKAHLFQNPLINTSIFSLVDLVKRFSVSNPRNNPSSNNIKDKSASVKKKSVAKRAASSKRNSFGKKTSKSTSSVRKYSKNVISKSDGLNLDNLDVKKVDAKTPRSIPKRNIRSSDTEERSIDKITYVRNTDTAKKSNAKIPSKTVQEGNNTKSIKVLKNYVCKNNVKANVKSSITPTTSDLHSIRNETTGKVPSDCDEKQINKLPIAHSNENAVQNQFLNNIPIISATDPEEMTHPFICSINDNHSVQNDNQTVSFEDLAIPGPPTLSNDHSSMENNECNTKIDPCVLINKTTTATTMLLENPVCQQEMRPRCFASLGVFAEQHANNYFQKTENICILRKQEIAYDIFLRHPSLKDITVRDFCNFPRVTNTFFDYLGDIINIPSHLPDVSKGYDFPENFESENLLSIIKDFVHSTIQYIIPKDGKKPAIIPYLQIMNAVMQNMSITEGAIMMRVFRRKLLDNSFVKLDDMLSKLNFVAMLVIFYEYKRRQIISNLRN